MDAWCRVGATSPQLRWCGPHPAKSWTLLSLSEIRLVHIAALPPRLLDAYPRGASQGLLRSGVEGHFWRGLDAKCIAAPFDDRPGLAPSPCEVAVHEGDGWRPATLHIGSFNTLSMRQQGAYASCARQMECHNLTLLGLQEARPREAGVSLVSGAKGKYAVASSRSADGGSRGCQLWVNLGASWGQGVSHHYLSVSSVTILEEADRYLLVRLKSARVHTDVLVAHGPYAGDEECHAYEFWEALSRLVNSRSRSAPALLAMIDANAASLKARDIEHRAAFVSFLAATGLTEATGATSGAGHQTFRSGTCSGVQIDYIAARGRVTVMTELAHTVDQFVSASAAIDHTLITVPIKFASISSEPATSRRRCNFDREAVLQPANAMRLRARLRECYVCDRVTEPTSECMLMHQQLVDVLAEICPIGAKKGKTLPFLSDGTFTRILAKGSARKILVFSLKQRRLAFVMDAFSRFRAAVALSFAERLLPPVSSVANLWRPGKKRGSEEMGLFYSSCNECLQAHVPECQGPCSR